MCTAQTNASPPEIRDHRTESASSQGEVRDHRQTESPVSLKVDQRLLLTNGNYVERLANGTVNVISTNGRVIKTFPQGKIVQDKSGGISIISGQQRVQAGQFKAIEAAVPNVTDHRTESASPQGEVRDHRQTERPVSLKVGQRLLLTNGSYVERQANGTVSIIIMNGIVVRTFPQGKIVQDKSGRISIISGRERVQAGQFKAIEVAAPNVTDHRTESASPENKARDHRQADAPVSLKVGQRLLLTNGSYVERQANGTVSIFGMNGRVVRTFPQGKIVQDKSGGISIISGQQRVQAGQFKAINAAVLLE